MKYYILKQYYNYSKWRVMLPYEEEKIVQLKQQITSDTFWSNPQTIKFKMVAEQLMVSTVQYADIHDWQHDLSIDMAVQPTANVIVISPALKAILEQFYCPDHRFYEATTTNFFNDSDEERRYFVFHLTNYRYKKLLFSQVECGVFENYYRKPILVRTYPVGEITSYDQFIELAKQVSEKDIRTRLDRKHPIKYLY